MVKVSLQSAACHSPQLCGVQHSCCVAVDEAIDVPRDAIVLRFRPTEPESVLRWAGKSFRETGRYRLSVYAEVQGPGESVGGVIARLLSVASADGIDESGNRYCWFCSAAHQLLDRGFRFYKEEDDRSEHYAVDVGAPPTIVDIESFLEPFSNRQEAWR